MLIFSIMNRPIQGGIKVDIATNTINVFETRLQKLQEDHNLVCKAKEVREQ
jgi:dynein heavy chain 1